jgi:MFS family permease
VMVVDALAALATGWAYDRFGPRVLLVLPVVAASIPIFALADSITPVIVGSLLWGIALGVQESTLRATVADLVGSNRRSTAYGIFAAIVGVATLGGGTAAGALYEVSIPLLIEFTIAIQVVALLLFGVFAGRVGQKLEIDSGTSV